MTKRKYNKPQIQKLNRTPPAAKPEVWEIGTKVRLTRDITLFNQGNMLGFHAGEKGMLISYENHKHVFFNPAEPDLPIAYIVQLEGFHQPTMFPLEYLEKVEEE